MYTRQELIDKLTPILERYPIKRAALFGSYARGEQNSDSDVDILLELDYSSERADSIYTFWDEIEETLTIKVDVLTLGSLEFAPERFRKRILSEMRYVYEA